MAYGNHKLRESVIEKKVTAYAEKKGWVTRKWKSPGRRSVPDQIFLGAGGEVFFIEFKAPGKEPTQKQHLEHGGLRCRGFEVFVIDNIGDGYTIIDRKEPI